MPMIEVAVTSHTYRKARVSCVFALQPYIAIAVFFLFFFFFFLFLGSPPFFGGFFWASYCTVLHVAMASADLVMQCSAA